MPQTALKTGLTATQLAQLCQPARIEHTLELLFWLNHWAKARDFLFYADRQGLYAIKGAILRQAYLLGFLVASDYVDGSSGFGSELAFDCAAEIAAESFLWRLEELVAPPLPRTADADPGIDPENSVVRQLYTAITGQETLSMETVDALEMAPVRDYILDRLHELERLARVTRQPVPVSSLRDLCIAPGDLFPIQGHSFDFISWDSWDQLESADLYKLDPEGLSLIAFCSMGLNHSHTFHLPLRLAEAFVPAERIAYLKHAPRSSREAGDYYGSAITQTESLQHPIADILRELGVDVPSVCPRLLSDKRQFMRQRQELNPSSLEGETC